MGDGRIFEATTAESETLPPQAGASWEGNTVLIVLYGPLREGVVPIGKTIHPNQSDRENDKLEVGQLTFTGPSRTYARHAST